MKYIIAFSGGKDSTALVLWALDNLKEFTTIFCDTGWEHKITYDYIDYINQTLLNGDLTIIKSEKYNGMIDMVAKKGRFPSTMARFCTEQLKVIPTRNYIKQFLPDVRFYLGIRAEESVKRAKMPLSNYDETYKCEVSRPLLSWTANEVIKFIQSKGILLNPLYSLGMKRVGCMPCIMSSHADTKAIIEYLPDVMLNLELIEQKLGKTFYPPSYIPDRFCTGYDKNTNKKYPKVGDVVNYLKNPDNRLFEIEAESCMSYYNLCE